MPLKNKLKILSHKKKPCQELFNTIYCPKCHEEQIIKYGFYSRYKDYHSSDACKISIQRFLCKNPKCTKTTFSITPSDLMRILRYTLKFMESILKKYIETLQSIYKFSKMIGMSYNTTKRIIHKAEQVKKWMEKESQIIECCRSPEKHWVEFCNCFSLAFYPKRFA